MPLSAQELLAISSRKFILGNTTLEEQLEFITDQIKDPFDGGDSNYFKKLAESTKPEKLDSICERLFAEIENTYPNLEFDYDTMGEYSLPDIFKDVYKFFIRNIDKLMYAFLKEYLNSAKNRNILTTEWIKSKLPNYPKEQYGKKEFYILIVKMPSIIKDIFSDNIRLEKFIETIERSGKTHMYFRTIKDLLDRGIILDHGVVDDFYKLFKDSDQFDASVCKLQMYITVNMINPYLEENGLLELRNPTIEPDTEDELDDDEDDDSDDIEVIDVNDIEDKGE